MIFLSLPGGVMGQQQVSFSPKVAKQKWQNIEQTINKVAYNKQTVSSMERDMERWLIVIFFS